VLLIHVEFVRVLFVVESGRNFGRILREIQFLVVPAAVVQIEAQPAKFSQVTDTAGYARVPPEEIEACDFFGIFLERDSVDSILVRVADTRKSLVAEPAYAGAAAAQTRSGVNDSLAAAGLVV